MRRTGGLDELTAPKRYLLVSKIVAEFQHIYEGSAAELEDEVGRLENEVFNSAINVEQYFALMGARSTSFRSHIIKTNVEDHTVTGEWEPNEAAGATEPHTTAAVDHGTATNTTQGRSLQASVRDEGGNDDTSDGVAGATASARLFGGLMSSARRLCVTDFLEEDEAGNSGRPAPGAAADRAEQPTEVVEEGDRSPGDQAGSDSAEGSCTAPVSAEVEKASAGADPPYTVIRELASTMSGQRLRSALPRLLVPESDLFTSQFANSYEAPYETSRYRGAYGMTAGTVPNSGQTSPHQAFDNYPTRIRASDEGGRAAGRGSMMSVFETEFTSRGLGGGMPLYNEAPMSAPIGNQGSFGRRTDMDFDLGTLSDQPQPQEVIFTRRSGPPRMCLSPGPRDPSPPAHFARAQNSDQALQSIMSAPAAPSRVAMQPRAAVPNPSSAYPVSTPDLDSLYKNPPPNEAVDAIRQHLTVDPGIGVGIGNFGEGAGYTENNTGLRGAQARAPSSSYAPTTGPSMQQQLQQEPWLMAPGIAVQRQHSAHNSDWMQAPASGMDMRSAAPCNMQLPPHPFAQPTQQQPQLQRRLSAAGMAGTSGGQPAVSRGGLSGALQQSRPAAQLPPLAPRQEPSWQQAVQQPPPWGVQDQPWMQSQAPVVPSGRQAKSPRSSMQKRSPLGSAGPLQSAPWENVPLGGGPSGSAPPSVMGHGSGTATTMQTGNTRNGPFGLYGNMEQLVNQQAWAAKAAAAAAVGPADVPLSTDVSMHNATATVSTNDDAAFAPAAEATRPTPAYLRSSWTSGYPQAPSVSAPTPLSLSVPPSLRGSSWSGDASAADAAAAPTGAPGAGLGGPAFQPAAARPSDQHDMLAFPRHHYQHQRPSQPPQNFYQPQSQDPEIQLLQQQLQLLEQREGRQAAGQLAQQAAWFRQPPPPLRTVSADWCGSLSITATASPSPYNSSSSPSPYRSQHSGLVAASSSSLGMNGLSLGLSTGGTTSGSDVWEVAQARGPGGGGSGSGTGGSFWGLGGASGSRQGDLGSGAQDTRPPLLLPIDTAPDSPGVGPLWTAYPVSPVSRKQELSSPPLAPFWDHGSEVRERSSMAGMFGGPGASSNWPSEPTGGGAEVPRSSMTGHSSGPNVMPSDVEGAEQGARGGQDGAAQANTGGGFTLERDVSLSRGMAAGPDGGGGAEAGGGSNGGHAEADDNVFRIGLNPLPNAVPDMGAMLN